MTTLAFIDCRLEVNSVDLSDWTRSVTLPSQFDELDDTAMGDTGRSRIAGLEDGSASMEFNEDYAAGGPDATIWACRGTVVPLKVRPTTASIGSTNPQYEGTYLASQVNPFGNAIGDLATRSIQWPLSDPDGIDRVTSA